MCLCQGACRKALLMHDLRKIIGLADVVLCVHDTDLSATDSGENRAFAFAVESHTPTLVLHPKELTACNCSLLAVA